jgi:hypothetical protein
MADFNASIFAPQNQVNTGGAPSFQSTPVAGNKYNAGAGMSSLKDIYDLQGKQLELQKARELLQPAIAKGKAESEQAVFNLSQVKADKVKGLANSLLASSNWTDPTKMNHEFEFVERTAKNQGLDVTSPGNPLELIKEEYKNQGPEAAYKKLYQLTYGAQAPETAFAGATKGIVSPPLPGQQQPSSAPSATEPYSQPEQAPYQPPVPGQARPQSPSEEGDRIMGEKYRQSLKPIQNQYPALRQNFDKLNDLAEKLAGSTLLGDTAAGTAIRNLQAKIGSPEYQQLSKDLANAQIAAIQANGGSLEGVAGQQLLAAANGSVTYDPKVLIDIVRRQAANLENSYAQSYGADKASQKFGDANVNRKFRTEWNKNSNDNAIFEMKYIFSRAKTPEEGAAAVAKYLQDEKLTATKRKELATKYLNLQKLQNEGSL